MSFREPLLLAGLVVVPLALLAYWLVQRRQVPQRPGRGDRGEDVDVGVADREPPAPLLCGDVGGDGQGQQPEADQHQWLAESHACG